MRPLTVEDLLPLEEFAFRRRELLAAHQRYVARCRRVRIGPKASLVFENRQTLWFRVQDLLRILRLSEEAGVQRHLDVYNRLLPGPGRLQAALLIDVDEAHLERDLRLWRGLRGESVTLEAGWARWPANLLTCRPEDRAIGAAHWVQFVLGTEGALALTDEGAPLSFRISLPGYEHESGPVSDDVRTALAQDLGRAA
jgi:hypothetical protein